MTVSYTADVANASSFGCFTTILLRWKGSVYKLIFKELAIYVLFYFSINIFYRTVLMQEGLEEYRRTFEATKAYCSIQMSSIPMTFGLGFYVSLIVKRWWDQYQLLPWPDSLAIFIVGLVHGLDERSRMMRRNIMRYTLLAYVITLRRISFRVRKRFPTMQHVVDAGLMRSDELKCMEILDEKCSVSKWWMPLVWATNIVDRARQEQKIKSDPGMQTILKEISDIRKGLTGVQHYDTISVPLVYTQVVTLAVYTYFGAALMGAQWVKPESPKDYQVTYKLPPFEEESDRENGTYYPLDLYYPFFLTLQFAFYVGWLKVAEILINPFGEDDDDFELNYIIDRHIQVAYMIVDEMHHDYPELLKDVYWNETVPSLLPYTVDTEHYRKEEPKGGAEKVMDEDPYGSSAYGKYGFFRRMSNPPSRKTSSIKDKSNQQQHHHNQHHQQQQQHQQLEPSSDYESVDTSLVGWWKAKVRRSQMRRSGRSLVSNNSAINRHQHNRKSSKSIKSSIYARILSGSSTNIASTGTLTTSSTSTTNTTNTATTTSNTTTGSTFTVTSSPSVKVSSASNSPASIVKNDIDDKRSDEDDSFDNDYDFGRFRQQSHLTTITENQNSPYSTHNGSSRRNSKSYVPIDGIFDNNSNSDVKRLVDASEESVNYYPLSGVEDENVNSAISKYFEDVANYEEVAFGEDDKTSESPASLLKFTATPTNTSVTATTTSPLVSSSPLLRLKNDEDDGRPSPMLPKRQARIAFDALHLKSSSSLSDNKDDEDNQKKKEEISSAFENATFYV